MSLLGVPLTFWIGPTVPLPPPASVMEALDGIEVTAGDDGRTGLQISFRVGRGAEDVLDYAVLIGPLLRPFSRVLLTITFDAVPQVLFDGVVTHRQFSPTSSSLALTGEDLSVMMDLEEKQVEHPAQPEPVIALKLIASYAAPWGLIPQVIPPPVLDVPMPTERTPTQQGTDLQYLRQMAGRFAYVFHVTPGPVPMTSTAYWGPPQRFGVPQRALSVDMGTATNVTSIDFQQDGLATTFVRGQVQDRRTNQTLPVQTFASTRPPLAREPAWLTQPYHRTLRMQDSGLDIAQAFARAQERTDASTDAVVTATGEADGLRYGGVLRPRASVGVRGVGDTHDGIYFVQRVQHTLRAGSYKQRFTLTREGTGAISPLVVP
jgi:hypothetical protein